MKKLTVLAIVFAALVTSVPAQADSVCNSGEFCVWGGEGYTGDFWDPSGSDPDWPCCGGTGVQNDDDSVKNLETYRVFVYENNDYSGTLLYCVAPGTAVSVIFSDRDNRGNSNLTGSSLTSCSGYPLPN